MLQWPFKKPGETLNYDWQPAIVAGDTIVSGTSTSSGVTIVSVSNTATLLLVEISGGTLDTTVVVHCTATTAAGDTFIEDISLPIANNDPTEFQPYSQNQISAQEIIAAAYNEMGVTAIGENPGAAETQNAMRVLNFMLKSFSARGVNLWRQDVIEMTVNSATITLDPSVDEISQIYVQQGNVARPLLSYARGQYAMLPNKGQIGFPTIYYANKQRTQITISFWPVPQSAAMSIYIVRAFEDVSLPDQMIDIPLKWIETVYIALAARLAVSSGVSRVDPAAASLLAQRAQGLEQMLFDSDRTSITMTA